MRIKHVIMLKNILTAMQDIAGLSSLNAAYEAAFEAGELDRNFFDVVSNLRMVQSVSLFARECEVN